ncbi:MAG: S41 family peptidase [Phycisphaerae bacterium]|nr:S41 family peptidase [Phycisphaerae bacterium]
MNDKHLRVRIAPELQQAGRASPMGPTPEEARRENWGFKGCEIADGNIGVLRFDAFVPTDEAKRVADAAMAFLGRCDALVFDLRQNGGGSPEMICYLSGYLFDKPTLLNRMKDRNGSVVREGFSAESVQGERFAADLPAYVVTSNRTFSGAEEFAYNLKNLSRATIVGETTGGGAHPVKAVRLDDRTVIMMPHMRAENPISQTNWEGTGVKPDVEVPAEGALEKALELARTKLGRK